MKKKLFHDILTETRIPVSLWKFFSLSMLIHAVLIFFILQADLKPPEVRITGRPGKHAAGTGNNGEGVKVRFGETGTGSNNGDEFFNGEQRGQQKEQRGQASDSAQQRGQAGTAKGTGEKFKGTLRGQAPDSLRGQAPDSVPDLYEPGEPEIAAPPVEHDAYAAPSNVAVYQYQSAQPDRHLSGDQYVQLYEKPFLDAGKLPRSGFPALRRSPVSYNLVKQSIEHRKLPRKEHVKIEELINFFNYDYPPPKEDEPFSLSTELGECPWRKSNLILNIGVRGKVVEADLKLRARDFIIADFFKISVKFNTKNVKAYRLIGYAQRKPIPGVTTEGLGEGRELRMGQTITTLYEIVPVENSAAETTATNSSGADTDALTMADIAVTFRDPEKPGEGMQTLAYKVFRKMEELSDDFNFSAAVAQFGMILMNPDFEKIADLATIIKTASDALGDDKQGYRKEFLKLLETYQSLKQ